MTDYKKLYGENEDFRRFVDKSSNSYGYTVEELLEHNTIREVGDYYAKKENDNGKCSRVKELGSGLCEDRSC